VQRMQYPIRSDPRLHTQWMDQTHGQPQLVCFLERCIWVCSRMDTVCTHSGWMDQIVGLVGSCIDSRSSDRRRASRDAVIGFPAQLSGLFSPSSYRATHRDLFFKLMPRVRVTTSSATFFPPSPPPTPTTLPLPPCPPPLATCGRGGTPTALSPTVEHASAPKPPLYSREDHRRHPQDNP
jgi:hypothetical protein